MTTTKTTITRDRAKDAEARLDTLLQRALSADLRVSVQRPELSRSEVRPVEPIRRARAPERLERLTVRFTQEEATMLEKARAAARSAGYKLSDSAVFRLAIRELRVDAVTEPAIRRVVVDDTRRRESPRHARG